MNCTDCGACCIGTSVRLTRLDETRALPGSYERVGGVLQLKSEDGRCIHFDPATRRCTEYADRPAACRNFLPGSADCHALRKRQRIGEARRHC